MAVAVDDGSQFPYGVCVRFQRSRKLFVKRLQKARIPTVLILDAAVGYVMSDIDIVLVGAEAVVESGGIVNKVG